MPDASHRSDPRILSRRTLQRDHRCLAGMLRPGYSVLDVGCGTGAITAGIAEAVGPDGSVIGIDRDPGLLDNARSQHSSVSNLRFEIGDALTMTFHEQFDIVTAARTLQWVADPAAAIWKMKQAAKRSGVLVVLDYNHTGNEWLPAPPPEFGVFYEAFLTWRQSNGCDNQMASHLPDLFRSAGLVDVVSHVEDEVTKRGDVDFPECSALWSEVIETLGSRLVAAGYCTDIQVTQARDHYTVWAAQDLRMQRLELRCVTGRVPAVGV